MNRAIVKADDVAHLLKRFVTLNRLMKVARLNGRLRYWRRHKGQVVRDNFQDLFGDEFSPADITRMTRDCFEYERIRSLLATLAPRMSVEELTSLFPIEGEEYLDEVVSRGKGAILLGSHLNSLIMFVAITLWRKRGYDIGVALPDARETWAPSVLRSVVGRFAGVHDTVTQAIGGFYCQFNIRPIVQRLRKNQIIGQTGDGWHSLRFVEVDFLGRNVPFTTGTWSIAQMTGAAILPLFISGSTPDGIRIILEEPVTVGKGEDGERELTESIATYARRLEHYLRDCVPAWQHWFTPNLLKEMVSLTDKPLAQRYAVK
jgi:lauroyl/myristoyl acyltransferase